MSSDDFAGLNSGPVATAEPPQDRMAAARAAKAAKRAAMEENPIAARLANRQVPRGRERQRIPLSGRAAEEMDLQRLATGRVKVESPIDEASGGGMPSGSRGSVQHDTTPRITLYRPVPQGYYVPAEIPIDNVMRCRDAGYLTECPDCGTTDCGPDPNTCTGRAPIPYRTCPVAGCNEGRGKKIYDDPLQGRSEDDAGEGEIVDDAFNTTTPAQRTKALLERHILLCHPGAASMYVINAPAPPSRGPVAGLDIR